MRRRDQPRNPKPSVAKRQGVCPVCGQKIMLLKEGKLAVHRPLATRRGEGGPRTCPGSRGKPK